MFEVHFFENKNLLLTQLLKQVPSEGEDLAIKGRKGKVANVDRLDEKVVHVQVNLAPVVKNKLLFDDPKKKKR